MNAKFSKNLAGTPVTDELHSNVGSGSNVLDHDTFFGGVDFTIRTLPGGGGTALILNTDYILENQDLSLSNEAGKAVYLSYRITNATYQLGALYFTYKTIGDFAEAQDINDLLGLINTHNHDTTYAALNHTHDSLTNFLAYIPLYSQHNQIILANVIDPFWQTFGTATLLAVEYHEKWHNGACLRRQTSAASSGLAYVRNLDLSKFGDGSASSNGDFIQIHTFMDGASFNNRSGSMRLNFYCDTYPGTTNYYEGVLDEEHWADADMMYLVKIQKSDFVAHGTPNWNAVKWIGFITSPSGQAGPVDIYGGSILMTRKDPEGNYPNVFQRLVNGVHVADFLDNHSSGYYQGIYFCGKEYNGVVFRDLMPSDYFDDNKGARAATLRSNQSFKNFELGINLMAMSTRLNHIGWEIDSTNRVFFTQDGTSLVLGYTINGTNNLTNTRSLKLVFGDLLSVNFKKEGRTFSLQVIKNNNPNDTYFLTADISNFENSSGRIAFGNRAGYLHPAIISIGSSILPYATRAKEAESVAGINPKLWDFGYNGIRYSLIPDIDTCFQKTVVGTGTATYDAANGYFKLTTSAAINDSVETQRIIALPLAANTFDRNRHFRVAVMLPNNTTNTVYVICGQLAGNNFFGFKIINGAVYGVSYKSGQSEQTVNLGVTMSNSVQTILEARLYAGSKIEFYINNFLYGTFTTTAQIPAGTTGANTLMGAKIQITAAAARTLAVGQWDFVQEPIY
jgi:hypothetical protein